MDLRMQSLHAVSLAPSVLAWLANISPRRILHVFESACNLINDDKEVLSVVTSRIGNGPFNLVVDGEVSFTQHIRVDSVVSILKDQLTLGELTVDTSKAELWNPRPDWDALHATRDKIVGSLLGLQIAPAAAPQKPAFESLVTTLCSAIVSSDTSATVSAAAKLAGLGSGLTPAGDDVMLGAMYAAWIIHPLQNAKSLVEEIASAAMPRTTSLSAAWLRSAARGETGSLWHQLFGELCTDRFSNPPSLTGLQNAVNRILMVGATSGADALSGFVRTLTCYAEKARA